MKKILGLVIMAVVMLAAVVWFNLEQPEQSVTKTNWHPTTTQYRASLTGLKIRQGERVIVDAKLEDSLWKMQNAADYPLVLSDLSTWYQDLLDSRVVEEKTAKAENYPLLGLADQAYSVELTFSQGNSEHLYLGNSAGNGMYVRRHDNPQSWLIDSYIQSPQQTSDWLETRPFTQIDGLEQLEFSSASERWQLQKEEDAWQLSDFNAETENYVNQNSLTDYIQAVKALTFNQVSAYQKDTFSDPDFVINLKTKEATQIVLSFKQQDEDWWVYSDDPKWRTWQFKLTQFSVNQVNKSRADFVELIKQSESELTEES